MGDQHSSEHVDGQAETELGLPSKVVCVACGYLWDASGLRLGTDVVRCLRCDYTPFGVRPGYFQAGDWVVLHEKPPAVRIFDPKPNEAGLLAVTWLREDESVHIGYCPPEYIRLAAAWEPRRP